MKVIIAGYIELQDPSKVKEMLETARPHVEGALTEEGCIAYDWSEDHLHPGRIHVYEEWASSATLEAHLQDHWYRDMGAHMGQFPMKPPTSVIKKYRVEHEEPVYVDGVATGIFSDGK